MKCLFTSIVALAFLCSCIPIDPVLSLLDPPAGWEGQVVIIEGTGFGQRQGFTQVLFSGVPVGRAQFWSETLIEIAVPPGAQTGQVWIRSNAIESNRLPFIVSEPPMEVVPVVRTYYLGWGAGELAVGDFNEDGRDDVAIAASLIVVLLSREDGMWDEHTEYQLDKDCGTVITADFDNDGHLDLVANGGFGEEIYLLLGDGQGEFGDPITSSVPMGIQSMAAADFDEDGFLDIIAPFGVGSGARVAVLFCDGQGGFGNPIEFYVGYQPDAVTVGDYNGDGHMDAAIANYGEYWGQPDTVSVVFGDGQGGFSEEVEYGVGDEPIDIVSADFDGDGDLDLAVANNNSSFVSVLLNDGQGGFAEHLPHDLYSASYVVAGDYNGDGIVDLTFTADGPGAYILLGYGDGTFLDWDFVLDCCIMGDLAQGDFDGNGILDLAISHGYDNVALITGDGSGGFGHVETYDGPGDIEMIVTGDFNEDGHADIAAAQGETVSLYFGDGEGGFSEPASFLDGRYCDGLVTGDWNRDGHLDLAAVRDEYMTILLGDGQGGFGEATDYELGSIYHFRKCIAVDDFNEDGIMDLVVVSSGGDGIITVFLGDGSGDFPESADYPVGFWPTTIATGDFDEDGFIDLVVPTDEGFFIILYGDGYGGFFESTSLPSEAGFVIAGDINMDDHLDLLLTGIDDPYYDLYFQVFKGNGDGTFEEPVLYFGGKSGLVLNDFNEDGLPDVVGVDLLSDLLFLSLGDGLGGFDHHGDFIAVGDPPCAASADFNEDGHADVVVGNDGYITIFSGDGLGGFVDFN